MTTKNTTIYRYSGIIFLLFLFSLSAATASNSDIYIENSKIIDPDKVTATKDPDKKSEKSDSIAHYNKEVKYKTDTTQQKAGNPSSMSSMSYNILFQVIYRFSFSEIFDSPSKSEIITD